jgi:hypothetical protein
LEGRNIRVDTRLHNLTSVNNTVLLRARCVEFHQAHLESSKPSDTRTKEGQRTHRSIAILDCAKPDIDVVLRFSNDAKKRAANPQGD